MHGAYHEAGVLFRLSQDRNRKASAISRAIRAMIANSSTYSAAIMA
jgi:hypothetical protein